MDPDFRPRDDDHLVEPLLGAFGLPLPPEAQRPLTRPWAYWALGVLALALLFLWWI